VDEFVRDVLPKQAAHTFGLFDGKSRKVYQMRLKNLDVLKELEPSIVKDGGVGCGDFAEVFAG